jgi:ribonuclease P protein component
MNRAHRLSSPREFRRVLADGARASSGSVGAVALRANDEGPARVGITATKRVGGAVSRNRARRRLREAIRPCISKLEPGTELVLVARPEIAGRPWSELTQDVVKALRKVGIEC